MVALEDVVDVLGADLPGSERLEDRIDPVRAHRQRSETVAGLHYCVCQRQRGRSTSHGEADKKEAALKLQQR